MHTKKLSKKEKSYILSNQKVNDEAVNIQVHLLVLHVALRCHS